MYVIYKIPIVLNIWFEHFLSHKYTTVIKNWYIFWTAQFPQRLYLSGDLQKSRMCNAVVFTYMYLTCQSLKFTTVLLCLSYRSRICGTWLRRSGAARAFWVHGRTSLTWFCLAGTSTRSGLPGTVSCWPRTRPPPTTDLSTWRRYVGALVGHCVKTSALQYYFCDYSLCRMGHANRFRTVYRNFCGCLIP